MARNPGCKVFVGNLDEKVDERVLYEILIQVGRVVDLHIPRDKETNRSRGIGFAEYESEQIADYAVRLFSGLVRLHNKILRFAIAGQDKPSQNTATPVTPKLNCPLPPNAPSPRPVHRWDSQPSQNAGSVGNFRVSSGNYSASPVHSQASPGGLVSNGLINSKYNRPVFGAVVNNTSRPAVRQPIAYPSY